MPQRDQAEHDLQTHAERLYEAMRDSVRRRNNEAGLRSDVEQVVRDAVADLYELTLDQIAIERTNAAGRLDVRYGGVVVEYAWNMRSQSQRRHEAQQALDYLGAEQERVGDDSIFSAVVADGATFGFLVADAETGPQLELLGRGSGPRTADEQFVWQPASEASCRRFLELIGSNPQAPVTGAALMQSLGRGSPAARQLVSLFVQDVASRREGERTDTLYTEWRRALEVAYGELDDADASLLESVRTDYGLTISASLGEFLFSLHSYFALISRLVAVEILSISAGDEMARPSNWTGLPDDELEKNLYRLEHGLIPAGLNIANLLEGDVFSWYLERLSGNVTLLNAVREACEVLGRYAFPRLAYGSAPTVDLLRDLYQGLTTRQLRKALGEFLTPSWLAGSTLEAATNQGADLAGRVLDCTCGTGTFLTPILKERIRELRARRPEGPSAEEVQDVLDSVVGLDINPVAVVASRLNYLIALGDLATVGPIYLPVWLADSVLLPDEKPIQGDFGRHIGLTNRQFLELPTSLSEPFVIPSQFVEQGALARLATLIRRSVDTEAAEEDFLAHAEGELGPDARTPVTTSPAEWENAKAVLGVLYGQILRLHEEDRNGVWAEIIENRFAPLFIGKFDVVVGNPPWLTWTKLPDAWRRAAAPIWRDYGLFDIPVIPGVASSRSLQTSDIATLVTAVALERYVADDGFLAFVAPKALINGDPANRAFRLYRLASSRDQQARRVVEVTYKLCEVRDFEDVEPFAPDASNSPIVLVIRKGQETTFPVTGARYSRKVSGGSIPDGSWSNVRAHLDEEPVQWVPISKYPASPLAWWGLRETPLQGDLSPYMFGVGLHTRGANGIFFVEPRGKAQSDGTIRITNLPDRGRDAELRRRGPQTGTVESDLVVPAVRGRDVTPYSVKASSRILLAHEPENRSQALTSHQMRHDYPGAYQFLRGFREILLKRAPYMSFKPTADQWWHLLDTEHMDGPAHFVCVREQPGGTQVGMAGVISEVWDDAIGRKATPVFDHKVIFYRTVDADEAYYLAGMINSRPVKLILERYANFISVSPQTLRYLPIPQFDGAKAAHKAVADASRTAHIATGTGREKAIIDVNSAVEAMLRA